MKHESQAIQREGRQIQKPKETCGTGDQFSKSKGSIVQKKKVHSKWKHGGSIGKQTPEYNSWTAMRTRCYNPKSRQWRWYGAIGISVCERWRNDFSAFLSDMGLRPTMKHTLDRIETSGNYTPDNCRWADKKVQARNTKQNVTLTHGGETLTIAEWSERTGINVKALYARREMGWSDSEIVTRPVAIQSKYWENFRNTRNQRTAVSVH